MSTLRSRLDGSPYQGYAYAYPHKTAYRPLDPPVALDEAWAGQRKDALFLYIHIPFCEMRCGFCNLFTRARPPSALVEGFLGALARQARMVRVALGEASFARMAVGGGTPTYLATEELEQVLDVAAHVMGVQPGSVPLSVEVSPATVTAEKLALLAERWTTRVSIGIESFLPAETATVQRPQEAAVVERALGLIRESGVPCLNLDLIYGLPGQTVASWLESVRLALSHAPEELYLYPLYIRPETGLDRSGGDRSDDELRLTCYREAQSLLLGEGYEQISMRMFRSRRAEAEPGPAYRCQEDGMVGLGCGARSYTSELHYSSEYAVRGSGVRAIIEDFVARPDGSFRVADYGCRLSDDDQKRRFVIQSLLSGEGLSLADYVRRFDSAALDDLPRLGELVELGLAKQTADGLVLTESGLARSDVIGPWLYSEKVRALMEAYTWR